MNAAQFESFAYGIAVIITLAIVFIPIALASLLIIALFKKIMRPKKDTKRYTEPHKEEPKSFATGWVWNENTKLWEPPDYKQFKDNYSSTYHHKKPANGTDTIGGNQTYANTESYTYSNPEPYSPPKQENTVTKDRYIRPNTKKDMGYKSKYLLTKNEWHEHKKLREYAAQKGLYVCPKVRLLDLVTPYGNGKDYMTRFHKVQAKHVDFVLVDESMHIKAIVELDDNSHEAKERQERDEFVDEVLSSVGYTVIHTKSVTESTLRDL